MSTEEMADNSTGASKNEETTSSLVVQMLKHGKKHRRLVSIASTLLERIQRDDQEAANALNSGIVSILLFAMREYCFQQPTQTLLLKILMTILNTHENIIHEMVEEGAVSIVLKVISLHDNKEIQEYGKNIMELLRRTTTEAKLKSTASKGNVMISDDLKPLPKYYICPSTDKKETKAAQHAKNDIHVRSTSSRQKNHVRSMDEPFQLIAPFSPSKENGHEESKSKLRRLLESNEVPVLNGEFGLEHISSCSRLSNPMADISSSHEIENGSIKRCMSPPYVLRTAPCKNLSLSNSLARSTFTLEEDKRKRNVLPNTMSTVSYKEELEYRNDNDRNTYNDRRLHTNVENIQGRYFNKERTAKDKDFVEQIYKNTRLNTAKCSTRPFSVDTIPYSVLENMDNLQIPDGLRPSTALWEAKVSDDMRRSDRMTENTRNAQQRRVQKGIHKGITDDRERIENRDNRGLRNANNNKYEEKVEKKKTEKKIMTDLTGKRETMSSFSIKTSSTTFIQENQESRGRQKMEEKNKEEKEKEEKKENANTKTKAEPDQIKRQPNVLSEEIQMSQLYNDGLLFHKKEMYQDAIQCYLKILTMDQGKEAASVHSNLGSAYLSVCDFPAALEAFNQAIAINPHYVRALYNRALVYIATGEKNKAIKELYHVLEVDPNHIKAKQKIQWAEMESEQ